MDVCWRQCPNVLVQHDTYCQSYLGWLIRLMDGNGGIVGMSISRDRAYHASTDGHYFDQGWHVEKAIEFIDSLGDQKEQY